MTLNLPFPRRLALLAILLTAAATRFIDLDSTPPGLWYDEGLNGLFARDVLAGDWRLFYGDREGLFFYPLAGAVWMFGGSVLALRWLAAAAGVLTVAALYAVGHRLFGAPTAIVAAAGLSVSFWHFAANRMAERVNLLPLFELLTVYCLWRAIYPRDGAPTARWTALAGAAFGLTLYTYLASRFFPFVLIVFALWQMVYERALLAAVWRRWLVVFGVAAIVFAPLALHYWRFPNDFILRSSQVWPYAGLAPVDLLTSVARAFVDTLGLFAISGDQNWRHNLPGRPAFDLVAAGALLIGVIRALLRRWRASTALCLIWLVVMLLPSALAVDNPHFLRAFGAIPAAWLLAAHGGVYLAANLATTGLGRDGAIIAGVLWFAYAAASNTGAYFVAWRDRPETAVAYEAGVVDGARVLNGLPTKTAVMASAWIQPHPSVTYLLAPGRTVTWFAGRDGLAVPPGDAAIALFGPAETAEPILRALGPPVAVGPRRSPLGEPLFRLYRPPADATLRPSTPTSFRFGDIVELDGVDIAAQRAERHWVVAAGQSL
ncbi:MAG: glycosyltransferase family 39 protein, partial [Dehalococcoidia bacterium]|nr:glycosyltransferase family 39 protein [Dehalococcoidia bacterium]